MFPLLKSQRNAFFSTLTSAGVDASGLSRIEWLESARKYYSNVPGDDGEGHALFIKDGPNEFHFYFNGKGDSWYISCYPHGNGNEVHQKFCTWNYLLEQLNAWGRKLSEEIYAPDLWSDISHIKSGFSFETGNFESNQPITAREAKAIKIKLEELKKELLENYGKTDGLKNIINEKFDRIDGAIEHSGKRDFIYYLIGALTTLAIQIGVSSANADGFWRIIKEVLGSPIKLLW